MVGKGSKETQRMLPLHCCPGGKGRKENLVQAEGGWSGVGSIRSPAPGQQEEQRGRGAAALTGPRQGPKVVGRAVSTPAPGLPVGHTQENLPQSARGVPPLDAYWGSVLGMLQGVPPGDVGMLGGFLLGCSGGGSLLGMLRVSLFGVLRRVRLGVLRGGPSLGCSGGGVLPPWGAQVVCPWDAPAGPSLGCLEMPLPLSQGVLLWDG